MKVNPTPEPNGKRTKKGKVKVAKQPRDKSDRTETWKLVALVVVFLIWISTASTLLFLYMDQYLFP